MARVPYQFEVAKRVYQGNYTKEEFMRNCCNYLRYKFSTRTDQLPEMLIKSRAKDMWDQAVKELKARRDAENDSPLAKRARMNKKNRKNTKPKQSPRSRTKPLRSILVSSPNESNQSNGSRTMHFDSRGSLRFRDDDGDVQDENTFPSGQLRGRSSSSIHVPHSDSLRDSSASQSSGEQGAFARILVSEMIGLFNPVEHPELPATVRIRSSISSEELLEEDESMEADSSSLLSDKPPKSNLTTVIQIATESTSSSSVPSSNDMVASSNSAVATSTSSELSQSSRQYTRQLSVKHSQPEVDVEMDIDEDRLRSDFNRSRPGGGTKRSMAASTPFPDINNSNNNIKRCLRSSSSSGGGSSVPSSNGMGTSSNSGVATPSSSVELSPSSRHSRQLSVKYSQPEVDVEMDIDHDRLSSDFNSPGGTKRSMAASTPFPDINNNNIKRRLRSSSSTRMTTNNNRQSDRFNSSI